MKFINNFFSILYVCFYYYYNFLINCFILYLSIIKILLVGIVNYKKRSLFLFIKRITIYNQFNRIKVY